MPGKVEWGVWDGIGDEVINYNKTFLYSWVRYNYFVAFNNTFLKQTMSYDKISVS